MVSGNTVGTVVDNLAAAACYNQDTVAVDMLVGKESGADWIHSTVTVLDTFHYWDTEDTSAEEALVAAYSD